MRKVTSLSKLCTHGSCIVTRAVDHGSKCSCEHGCHKDCAADERCDLDFGGCGDHGRCVDNKCACDEDLLGSSVRIKNVPIIAQGMETVTSRVAFASVYLDLLAVTVLTLCLAQMTAQVKSKVYVFQQSEFLSYMFCLSASLAFPLIIVFSDISTILAY